MSNTARETFLTDGTFTPKAGVNRVRVLAENLTLPKGGLGGGTGSILQPDGQIWSWGLGTSGQLGDATIISKSSPVKVVGSNIYTQHFGMGGTSRYAIDTLGGLWSWGVGVTAGNAAVANLSSPVQIGTTVRWGRFPNQVWQANPAAVPAVTNMGLLDSQGNAWVWGNNSSGQIGDGTVVAKSVPTQVAGTVKFQQMGVTTSSGGQGTCWGLDTSNNLWTWGGNGSGVLGQNQSSSGFAVSSPVQVSGANKYQQVYMSGVNVVALDTAGNAWCWGQGTFGANGNNSTANVSSPVQVSGAVKFTSIVVSAGSEGQICYGLDTAGNAWAWGFNSNSALGDGTIAGKSSPVQVLGGIKFSSIYLSTQTGFGIDTSNNLWAWGLGNQGQLGSGSLGPFSSPTQVSGSLKWSYVFTNMGAVNNGQDGSQGAVDLDGQVWCWGLGTSGQVGDGTAVSKSSPVKIVGPSKSYTLAYPQQQFFFDVVPGQAYPILVNRFNASFGSRSLGIFADRVTVEYTV